MRNVHEPDVRDEWNDVAAAWERHEAAIAKHHEPLRRRLLDLLDPQPGETILELAGGTGALTRSIGHAVGSDGTVLCTDVAPRMVRAARRRAADEGVTNIRCTVMDAHDIDLPDDSVDAVLCSLGFMLMPDPARALSESRRVLSPGGRLVLSVWGSPEHNPWLLIVGGALLHHGHAAQADPTGPGGVFSLSDPELVTSTLADAGLDATAVESVEVPHRFDSFDEYWRLQTATGGPIAAVLSELDPGRVEEIRETCREFSTNFATDDGYVFPGQALVVSAR